MKSIYLSIVLSFMWPFSCYPNPSIKTEAILKEDVVLQEGGQQLKAHLFDGQKKKSNSKEIIIIGQVRATSIPHQKDSKVVQIVWIGLQGPNKKRVSFKESLVSTFKTQKGSLSKGYKMALFGHRDQLHDALKRLEKGEEDNLKEVQVNNPESSERRLEDLEESIKRKRPQRNPLDYEGTEENISSQDPLSLLPSKEGVMGNSSCPQLNSKSAASLIRQPSHSQHQLSTKGSGSSLRRMYGRGDHLNGHPSSSNSPFSLNNASQNAHQGFEKSFAKDSSKMQQEEGKTILKSPFDSSRPESSSDHNLYPDFQRSHDKDFNPLKINTIENLEGDKFKMPHIEVEITKEGCRPTIDLERSKVIVQTRSMTRKNGVLVSETPCRDSDLIFDIKKDYRCCSDKVDETARVAYTTFRRYYLDEGYNKVYLDAECIKDESQPHPFIEEKGNCRYEIHLPSRLAYPQCETVYYDRSNAKKIVKGCHRSGEPPLPIIATAEGCPLKHVYEQNKSFIQNKEVFVDHGIVHEVVPCHETEESIPHQFVKAGCKPLVNGSQVTPMAKRQIVYKGKQKIIKEQCEPQDLTQLQSTKVGCEGQYEHDFNSGRSYPLARHYYYWGGKNRFIDKICRRSNQALDHLREIIGYEHVDSELKSKPRYQISIEDQKKKHILQELTEDNKGKWIPYTLKETIEKPSKSKGPTSQGSNITFATDKIEVWTRPDGSLFEKVIGTGTAESISISPNDGSGKIVISVTEQVILPGPYIDGSMKYKVRKVTRYSDGSIDFGRPFIRVVPDSGQYISDYHSAPNFYFEHNE